MDRTGKDRRPAIAGVPLRAPTRNSLHRTERTSASARPLAVLDTYRIDFRQLDGNPPSLLCRARWPSAPLVGLKPPAIGDVNQFPAERGNRATHPSTAHHWFPRSHEILH